MNKDKQIEEMARDICHLFKTCEECQSVSPIIKDNCKAMVYAKRAVDAGYRKASDVAREIFEEIETSLHYKLINGEIHLIIRETDYNHYKKKYTEGGE